MNAHAQDGTMHPAQDGAVHDHSGYIHGQMEIVEQSRTWKGFMQATWWGAGLVVLALAYSTLVFAVGLPWFGVLIGVLVLSLIMGAVLRLGGAWIVVSVILTVVVGIGGVIAELAKAAIAGGG